VQGKIMNNFMRSLLYSLLAPVLFSMGAHALSTTDFLVRLEALQYLDVQLAAKQALEGQEHKTNAMTTDEAREMNRRVAEANEALAQLLVTTQEEVEILKTQKEAMKGTIKKKIEGLEGDLASAKGEGIMNKVVNGQKKTWTEYVFGKPRMTQEEIEAERQKEITRLAKELAFWRAELEKIRHTLGSPEGLSKEVAEKFEAKKLEWEGKRADALAALAQLEKSARVMDIKSAVSRLKERQVWIKKGADCLIKLAVCKDIKSWDTYTPGQGDKCKTDYLAKAKSKATTPSCKALEVTSSWDATHQCIPEYRSIVLKGEKGELGSRVEFDKCRSL
jgi:hypothetical protein